MTHWYVKDLSKLCKVSVQTLHHYDRIGLLKPSIRQDNGYRLYSEKDLLKLQQIVALKFFGFNLIQIKTLLASESKVIDHFAIQSKLLREKASGLLEASKALDAIIAECKTNKSIPWETIIDLIEVYHMTQQLEHAWIANILNPNELKEYVEYEKSVKSRFSKEEKKAFEKEWLDVMEKVGSNLNKNPESDFGIEIGEHLMKIVNAMYGKKYVSLRNSIWEKGYKNRDLREEHGLTPKMIAWVDKAIEAYFKHRIYEILALVEKEPSQKVKLLWDTLLEDLYGDAKKPEQELIETILKDRKVSTAAKNWVKTTYH